MRNRPLFYRPWGNSLLLLLLVWGNYSDVSAQRNEYLVEFDTGKTEISLQQVARIQALAEALSSDPDEKVVVYAYASDARIGDTNDRLARRRSYLLQQCLERAGVPLSRLHIRHLTCAADELGCPPGARIWIERNADLEATNLYQERNRAYVWEQNVPLYEQVYAVLPNQNTLLSLRSGHSLYVPQGAFEGANNNDTVLLRVRELKTKQALWVHGYDTRGVDHYPNGILHLSAEQNGHPLNNDLRRPLTYLERDVDRDADQQMPYWYENHQWIAANQSSHPVYVMDYNKEAELAAACTKGVQSISVPVYKTPPPKPNYIHPDSATVLQDAAIEQLTNRLEDLEAVRYDKSGKKERWTPQQKERAYTLQNQRAQLLVQREKIRRQALNNNALLEETYYRTLAVYNQQRNAKQQAFLKQRTQNQGKQLRFEEACARHQKNRGYWEQVYTARQRQDLLNWQARQPELSDNKHYYWTTISALGSLANSTHHIGDQTLRRARLLVKTPVSAYKVTAYLEDGTYSYTSQAQDGETLFFEYPKKEVQNAWRLWAVVEGPDGYEVATAIVRPDQPPVTLTFERRDFSALPIFEMK